MGMEVGGKKGGAMASMNVVPLIDILLVLLIIFMVITPLTPKGLDALVPQPAPRIRSSSTRLQRRPSSSRCWTTIKLKINEDRRHLGRLWAAAERHLQAARRKSRFRQGR